MNNKIVLLTLFSFFIHACLAQHKPGNMKTFDYEKAWQEVTDYDAKKLPESARKIVNEIYKEAKAEKNAGQLVKAVVHQLKFTDYKEDNAFITNLNTLKAEADQATFPVKPLLHSMLGEMYWQYYQNNRHEFYNRTETTNADEQDIETWSLAKIVKETFEQYKLSLQDPLKAQSTRIDVYEPVLHHADSLGRKLRPTLYDFLAHRAVDFFSSSEPEITKPVYFFTLSEAAYLSDNRTFSALKIESKDTLSMKFWALTILQDLIRFHLNDKDPESLVDIDIKRLHFVRANLTLANKDELYLKALEQLEQNVQSNPVVGKVTVEKARVYVETGSRYNPLQSDDYKWDFKKAYTMCEEAKRKFPQSDGAILCENLQEDILNKSISACLEKNNIPNEPFRSLIRYQNFTSLHYRIIKINRDEVQALRKKLEKDYSGDREQKFVEHFIAKTPFKTGVFTLPDDGDYQSHSIEVKIDPLPEGEYMVLYSHNANFATTKNGLAYTFTVISNISYLNRDTPNDGGTEFYTVDRRTGEPLAGVTAEVYYYKYHSTSQSYEPERAGTFVSDATGYFKIPYLKKEDSRSFYVNFKKGIDFNSTQTIDNQYYYYNGSISQYKSYGRETHLQTFFFLDRAIYRPGQTIYFKGLVVQTDGQNPKIQTKYRTRLSLRDVNDQEQGTVDVTTNEYGTFSGTFVAPSTGLTGNMVIQSSDDSGEVSFSVEEYKRPKFEVAFETVKGSFKLGETINVNGYARAYSGANIDGATVSYRVVRAASFPFWWWCRWGYYPRSPEMEILHGTSKTDVNGKFAVDFTAVPDLTVSESSDPTFSYTVYADVTDINGETHSSSTYVLVGYKSLVVGVAVENINTDSVKSEKEFAIRTTNLAGEFTPAKGSIKVYQLKTPSKAFRKRLWQQPDRSLYSREEYYKLFPHDLFEDEENKYKWERSNPVFAIDFDTDKKRTFSVENIRRWNSGEYVLEIIAKDKDGKDVKEVTYFSIYTPTAKSVPVPSVDYFQPLVLQGEPGEKALFVLGTSEKNVRALYEVEYDGKILAKEWLTLKNEQRIFAIPLKEEHRGNLAVHVTFILDNRLYVRSFSINVPYSNKVLDISFASFRDKLQPGASEQWKIVVKGRKADKVAAEMVATLYDQSLDEFRSNYWYGGFYNSVYAQLGWESVNGFSKADLHTLVYNWNPGHSRSASYPYFDSFNWFGYSFYHFSRESRRYRAGMAFEGEVMMSKSSPAPARMAEESADDSSKKKFKDEGPSEPEKPQEQKAATPKLDLSDVKVRKNFNETAFFYPHLNTNEKGEIIISFTIPEALTRWKMLGFAHTKDLSSGSITNQLVTQKDLMVVPNQPRFFRENDKMKFSAKISSLVDKDLAGQVQLQFFDALTMKEVDGLMKNKNSVQNFSLKAKQSTSVEWSIEIPENLQAVMYRIVAKAGDFSDGEEMTLPVVTNRMLVTETMPLPIRGKQTKEFRFEKLLNTKSTTLRHQRYTLEFTSNPAWYAIQALPYLMEYPYECVEQTFSRFYANSIATHIANASPRIKQVFDTWKNIQPDALLSNLEKNQELKSALLEETPWVLQAKDESQRKRMVGVLFDLNRMANEQERALDKVVKAQESSGGFSWFPGFKEDRYMTQHIIAGTGHLDVMGVKSVREDDRVWHMVSKAISYLDAQIQYDYEQLKAMAKRKEIDLNDNHINYLQFHYLYTRSYFKDVAIPSNTKEAFDYFLGQSKKYGLTTGSLYMQGMTCLALNRFGAKEEATAMIKSFKERALHSEEMGMYWKTDYGYYWYQAPIETQALMIEVFDEVAADQTAVEDMKAWLLKQKQTQDWKTTKATVEACYALLRRGVDALANTRLVDITIGNQRIDPLAEEGTKVEAGTGYFKKAWQANEINADFGKIKVSKSDDGVAWGAVYWQYFEQLDKITPAETSLKLKKDLFLKTNTDRGPVIAPITDNTLLSVGDLVKVRIELRVDRNLEYVHLKDMRAAGFEPVSTLSTSKYQDGLYYYESPRDLATNFFMGYLPKGTYVFEYDLRASQKGDFSNGVTTIQCMYAPEFTSHSQGIRVQVK